LEYLSKREPSTKRSVPLNYTGGIYVRPRNDYSTTILNENSSSISLSSHKGGDIWSCIIHKRETLHFGSLDYCLEILPLIIIENCLANILYFRTRHGSTESKTYNIQASSEECIMSPASLKTPELILGFRLPGFEWAEVQVRAITIYHSIKQRRI